MSNLPPGVLAQQLVLANPLLGLVGSRSLRADLLNRAARCRSWSGLVQWLQANPDATALLSGVLRPDKAPLKAAVLLPAGLLDALCGLWCELESSIFGDERYRDLCWTSIPVSLPGVEPVSPDNGGWQLSAVAPLAGLAFSALDYRPDSGLSLTIVNHFPRHVGVYAVFLEGGQPVAPAGWTSRLPPGVSLGLETATMKFLAWLTPDVSVSAIPLPPQVQTVRVPIPGNADRVRLVFGGLGIGGFDRVATATGVMLTALLDFAVPWFASLLPENSAAPLAQWFPSLLADASIVNAVAGSGRFIVDTPSIVDMPSLLDKLASGLTAVYLDDVLKPLRDALDSQFGTSGDTVAPSLRFVASIGWSAQILGALLQRSPPTQAWPAQVDGTNTLELDAATAVALHLEIEPDPRLGSWPYPSAGCAVRLRYGGPTCGYSQSQTLSMAVTSAQPLRAVFGSVRNSGRFDVDVALMGAGGERLASGIGELRSPPGDPTDRTRSMRVTLSEPSPVITGSTRFVHRRSLVYAHGEYSWDPNPQDPANAGALQLVGITLQEATQSLGYVWRAATGTAPGCDGGGTISQPYFIRNIGSSTPERQLKTLGCGFVRQPLLAYGTKGLGLLADPRGDFPCLRAVALVPGPFTLDSANGFGRFRESSIDRVAVHPDGFVAAINSESNRLEVLRTPSTPVSDGLAPASNLFCGQGSRTGLLLGPVGLAVAPGGALLVLEQGNSRIQAFDTGGNGLAIFNGKSIAALTAPPGAGFADLAVSPAGFIYVVWKDAAGAAGFDVYDPNINLLCRTGGIGGDRIAVDSRETLYVLSSAAIIGPSGQPEPSIAVWAPS